MLLHYLAKWGNTKITDNAPVHCFPHRKSYHVDVFDSNIC